MDRYDLYKDSGVEWIGEIPFHWKKSKLKFVSEIVTGNTPPTKNEDNYEGGEYLWVKPNEIKGLIPTNDTNQKLTEKGKSLSRVLPPYSVLVNGIGRIGEFGYSEKSVSTNQQINSIIYNQKVDKRYGLFHTSMMKEGFLSNSEKVVVPILNKTKQENIEFILPPLQEQKQIVSFLDTKISLIDSLIEKTQLKIELLKEQRTSLINEVVTKGLNHNVELKDSGVKWIGKIPIHWVTTKLGLYTTKVGSGSTPRGGSEIYVEVGIPFIRSQNVHFDGLKLDNVSFIEHDVHDSMKGSVVVKNDVLLNITGGSIGRCCVVNIDIEMNVNQHVSIIRTKEKLLNYFLNYIISCDVGQSQVRYNLTGGNREGLTIEGIKNFQISLPPLQEQKEIVEYLDNETQLIDKTISNEEKRIELLKEYRQSLISEVVTGKIKVSEV